MWWRWRMRRPCRGCISETGKTRFPSGSTKVICCWGGRSHRTGNRRKDGCFTALKEMGNTWYPKSHAAACWAAQDCITADEIPFIGNYAAGRPHWFVATGFRKWGMSSAMVSSMLLRDQICGRENPWSRIFTPSRFSAQELPQILRDGGIAVKGLSRRLFQIPAETADALLPGQGALVETEEGKAGVVPDPGRRSLSGASCLPAFGM